RRGRWIVGFSGGMGPQDARLGDTRGREVPPCGSRRRGAGRCTGFNWATRSRSPMAESWLYGKRPMGTRNLVKGR
uniref:Uncharacterized protein n=1 Tax=Oryza brachyantha TaxID=4533 RepID=J3LGU3_ORYBR